MSFVAPASSPIFLSAQLGDIVVVEEDPKASGEEGLSWWLGRIIHATGGARNPRHRNIFQVVDVDTGLIKTINADLVKGILKSRDVGPFSQ